MEIGEANQNSPWTIIKETGSYYLEISNDYLNYLPDTGATLTATCISSLYKASGYVVASIVGAIFDEESKQWVSDSWTDPLSTERILAFSEKLEIMARRVANRQPTQSVFLNYLDVSLIGAAQLFSDYLRHSNDILRIAPFVKKKLNDYSFVRLTSFCNNHLGPLWWVFTQTAGLAKQVFFYLIYLVIKVVDFCIPFFFYAQRPKAFDALKEMVFELTKDTHRYFPQVAQEYISKQENSIRKEIVTNATFAGIEYIYSRFYRVVLKGILGFGIYAYFRPTLLATVQSYNFSSFLPDFSFVSNALFPPQQEEFAPLKSLASGISMLRNFYFRKSPAEIVPPSTGFSLLDMTVAVITGALVWEFGTKPSLEPYHEQYGKSSSTLLDYCKDNSLVHLYPYFKAFKKALQTK